MKTLGVLVILGLVGMLLSCSKNTDNLVNEEAEIKVFTLKNKNGIQLKVTNFGARVMEFWVPDANGNLTDIVLGFDTVEEYSQSPEPYFGATIGRYGNRINQGKFILEGKEFKLAQNNGNNSLHGGPKGFHHVVWEVVNVDDSQIVFTYLANDGEEGFPGNLKVKMIYSLNDEGEFKITYEAETDKTTVLNLTHHSFFNLDGAGNGSVLDHYLQINAHSFTPVNKELIPLGEIQNVENSPFDFTSYKKIGKDILTDDQQIQFGGGYDHNWVLDKKENNTHQWAASVYSEKTGIQLDVFTTEPGLQFYSGNFLDGKILGKGGKSYTYRSAFCLETQHFPDSPNQPQFPTTVLRKGEVYQHECIYKITKRS
jgi:aldose 1-epimerase